MSARAQSRRHAIELPGISLPRAVRLPDGDLDGLRATQPHILREGIGNGSLGHAPGVPGPAGELPTGLGGPGDRDVQEMDTDGVQLLGGDRAEAPCRALEARRVSREA